MKIKGYDEARSAKNPVPIVLWVSKHDVLCDTVAIKPIHLEHEISKNGHTELGVLDLILQ